MKFKPLALMILLALPMLLTIPIAQSAPVNPKIWVSPGKVEKWAPCRVSEEFTVDIKLWNKKEITGVSIYAYDFKVTWNKDLITFVKADIFVPWPAGQFFIIKNYYDATGNFYHLAVTALDTAPPLDDHQLILVTIRFHIKTEPCWDDVFTTSIDVYAVKLSDPCGVEIPLDSTDVTDGTYTIYSSKPAMWLTPKEFTYGCICKDQVVTVMLANATRLYGFEFKVTWSDPNLLEANIQCVKITDILGTVFEVYLITVGDDYVSVKVLRPCTKPVVTIHEGAIATICFHTCFDLLGKVLPANADVTLTLTDVKLYVKCPEEEVITDVKLTGALYKWRPKVEDLDLSCHVDITDLSAIAAQYGKEHPAWNKLALPDTGNVDLFDIVVVAKKFCKK